MPILVVKTQTTSVQLEMTLEQRQQVILQDPKRHLNEIALKLDTVVNIWQTVRVRVIIRRGASLADGTGWHADQSGYACSVYRFIHQRGR